MPLISAARVVKCRATWPVGLPGYPCVKASRMARYWRRLSLIACSFSRISLNKEYTMSQPLIRPFNNSLEQLSGSELAEYHCRYDGQDRHVKEIRDGVFFATQFASPQGALIPLKAQE